MNAVGRIFRYTGPQLRGWGLAGIVALPGILRSVVAEYFCHRFQRIRSVALMLPEENQLLLASSILGHKTRDCLLELRVNFVRHCHHVKQ
jgi:hypothetical protein